ncbi:MAG: tyrosine-type recombinase/integrase [Cyclobacteriaceae bacterium]|nr:tyrosine-type recombinase/integrase [Cyclobacteriaceae bacterium]MCH8515474.1 tyrosine-type recombinase/integrase [Cyclobacteriaceae bacterium]
MKESFLNFIAYEKRSGQHTLTSYRTDLEQFEIFCQEIYQLDSIEKAEHFMIRSWIVNLMEAGKKTSTVNRKIATLKSFYKFLMRSSFLDKDPTQKIRSLKKSSQLPQFIREDELISYFEKLPEPEGFIEIRDRLIIDLLYGTGIRLNELIELTEENLSGSSIKVMGKGSKERMIPLPTEVQLSIKRYQREKEKLAFSNTDTFLCKPDGEKLYPMLVYRTVKKYLTQVNVDKKSPHVLRHSFATHLLNKGAELNAIKDLLGHAGLAATQVYTHNSTEKLKQIFEQAHPKGK